MGLPQNRIFSIWMIWLLAHSTLNRRFKLLDEFFSNIVRHISVGARDSSGRFLGPIITRTSSSSFFLPYNEPCNLPSLPNPLITKTLSNDTQDVPYTFNNTAVVEQ